MRFLQNVPGTRRKTLHHLTFMILCNKRSWITFWASYLTCDEDRTPHMWGAPRRTQEDEKKSTRTQQKGRRCFWVYELRDSSHLQGNEISQSAALLIGKQKDHLKYKKKRERKAKKDMQRARSAITLLHRPIYLFWELGPFFLPAVSTTVTKRLV